MSWQKKAGHEHNHIDGRTGVHTVRLHNAVTGGEHLLHIRLGTDECPACKRPFPKDDLGASNPAQHVADAIEMLSRNHEAIMRYAATHGVPVKVSGATTVPSGQTTQVHGGHTLLMPPRKVTP